MADKDKFIIPKSQSSNFDGLALNLNMSDEDANIYKQ
jgi:hypothetical protein